MGRLSRRGFLGALGAFVGAVATCRIVGAGVEIPHCSQHGPEALAEALR